ncbi:MAG TPA: hypothetical protein VFV17_09665 [Usitatibacteraceae bacterium]|nr:hypothetical protein [Usitatibacteraceae bacterium]
MRTRLLLLSLASVPAWGSPVDELRVLFESGRSGDAAAFGLKHPHLLGQPDFDYFYGMALIDSGQPAKGVLALERHLLHRPDSLAARAELGRGYFLMGDLQRSREMFGEVLSRNPPADLRQRAEDFLAAIRQRESAWRTSWSGHVEIGGGHDGNANSGVASDLINVPLFGAVTIDPTGRQQGDRFGHLAAGLQLNVPISPAWSAFAALGADARQYRDVGVFDQRNSSVAAGVTNQRGDNQWRLSVNTGRLDVDAQKYRTLGALTLDLTRKIGPASTVSAYLQGADIRYEGENRIRDARLAAVGAQIRKAFDGSWKPLLVLGFNGGREDNRRDRDDLDRRLIGSVVSTALTFSPRWGSALTAQAQRSRYGADDALFQARRDDHYRSLEWSIGNALSTNWSARVEVSRIVNSSSVPLYAYARNQVGFKLRYDVR